MATFDYNPITGQLDLVGAGGGTSYIDGEVEYHSNLPVTAGTPAVNSAFLVRKGEGLYFVSRKPAGIWVRELNNGNLDDWKFAGTFSDLYRDANFRILNNTDITKELAFDVSGVTTGTTRTLTVPNASGTISLQGHTHVSANITDATSDETPNTIVKRDAYGNAKFNGIQVTDVTPPVNEVWLAGFDNSGTIAAISPAESRDFIGLDTDDAVTFGSIQNTPIGSTTRNAGAFTTLNATNGTITASASVLDLSQTWNNAAVTFRGVNWSFVETAAGVSSEVLRISTGAAGTNAIFNIRRDGNATFANAVNVGTPAGAASIAGQNGQWRVSSGGAFGFCDAANNAYSTMDTFLSRDASDTLAQRRGANGQTYRLYNTYTDASNHERLSLRWASNVAIIGTEKAGTGSARALELQTDGTTRLTLTAVGLIQTRQGASLQLFASSASNHSVNLQAQNDGILRISNNANSDFSRLQFGGTTSSFPALKRDSTALQVRLADDSAYSVLDAQLRAQGTAPATSGATGTAGDIRYDADYIYVCTAASTWKRAAIATW